MNTSLLGQVAGPHAALAIEALRDLGLSHADIARYFRINEAMVLSVETVTKRIDPAHKLRSEPGPRGQAATDGVA